MGAEITVPEMEEMPENEVLIYKSENVQEMIPEVRAVYERRIANILS